MSDADAERAIQSAIDRWKGNWISSKDSHAISNRYCLQGKIALLSKVERNFNENWFKKVRWVKDDSDLKELK